MKAFWKFTKIAFLSAMLFVLAAISYFTYSGDAAYFYQLLAGNYRIMSARVPVSELLSEDEQGERSATFRMVLDVRKYAGEQLGLPRNKSYTLFSDIKREFLGWNVYATDVNSVEPQRWCFPIAGCIVYRGYFDLSAAKTFAGSEEALGKDVYVGPITAYSTLGNFDDPILSSHLRLPDFRLAAMIIHELAHQRLYFPGKSEINEAFAVVVEREGLVRWLKDTQRSDWLPRVQAAWAEEDRQVGLLLEARTQLRELYGQGGDPAEITAKKKDLFDKLQLELCGGICSGDGLPKAVAQTFKLNNAYLTPVYTYYGKYQELRDVLEGEGGDLNKFYEEVEARFR